MYTNSKNENSQKSHNAASPWIWLNSSLQTSRSLRAALLGLMLAFAPLLLVACNSAAPVYTSATYTPPSTPGGRMCINECRQARDYCQQSCTLDYRACYNEVQESAQSDYDRYARDRFSDHLPLDRFPSDFEHPETCNLNKKDCFTDCDHPYDTCYRSCGGSVTVTTSCQFLCFE